MRSSTWYIYLKKASVGLTTRKHMRAYISTCFQRRLPPSNLTGRSSDHMTRIFTHCSLTFALTYQLSPPFIRHFLCAWYCIVLLAFSQLTSHARMHSRHFTSRTLTQSSIKSPGWKANGGERTLPKYHHPVIPVRCPVLSPQPRGQAPEQLNRRSYTSLPNLTTI